MPIINEKDITFFKTTPEKVVSPEDVTFFSAQAIPQEDIDFFEEEPVIQEEEPIIQTDIIESSKDVGGAVPSFIRQRFKEQRTIPEFKKGIKSSIPGMAIRQDLPIQPEGRNLLERTAYSVGQYAGDSPFYALGGLLGATGGGIGAVPGAFALPAGIRKVLMDTYNKGQIKTWKEFSDRGIGALYETGKGALVGKTVGIAGKYAPGLAKVPAEIGAMVTAGSAVEGEIPSLQDFVDASVFIGGMHGVMAGVGKVARIRKGLQKKYVETGETPKVVVEKLKSSKQIVDTAKGIKAKPEPITMDSITKSLDKAKLVSTGKESLDKYAGSVNIERQKISTEAKAIEHEIFALKGEKHRISHKKQQEASLKVVKKMVKDPEFLEREIRKVKEGKTPDRAVELAFRELNAYDMEVFVEAVKKVGAGEMSIQNFHKLQNKISDNFLNVVNPLASEAGRRLNAYNIEVGKYRVQKAISKLDKAMNERQRKEFVELVKSGDINDPVKVKVFTDRLPNPKAMDYVYEFWYNSILSGLPTHAVNVISNTLWSAYQVPHRAHVGFWDAAISTLTGRQRETFIREGVPLLAGYKSGFAPGAKGAWKVIKTGRTEGIESKWALDIGLGKMSAFERSPYKILNNRFVAFANSASLRALQAMDVWAKSMGMDAEIKALTRRKGLQKGLKGKELKDYEAREIKNIDPVTEGQAQEFSRHVVFMNEPGRFTNWILKGRDIVPGSRFVVPFVNTISNLTQRGIERTPGLGIIFEGYKKVSRTKEFPQKSLQSAEVIANQIEGSAIALYMLYKADKGEITGSPPQIPSERDAFYRQGKVGWGLKIGKNWHSYRRIEPFNTVLASTAITYEAIKNTGDEETATEIFGNFASGITDNLLDSSYLQGVTNALDKYGRRRGMFQRLASSFVPYSSFLRSINRAIEVGLEGSTKVRDTKDLLGAFTQIIPGIYDLKEPRLNVWGEEIELAGTGTLGIFRQWLPYKWAEASTDPVEIELEKLGFYPGLPGKHVTVNGERVELPDDIYRNYSVSYGSKAKQRVSVIIVSGKYKRLDEKGKHDLLDSELTKIRNRELTKAKRAYWTRMRGK